MAKKESPGYPFERLDEMVGTGLNPETTKALSAGQEELADWQRLLRSETSGIWKKLKSQTFRLLSRKKISTVLTQYQECLDDLKRQAMVNMAAYPEDDPLNSFCDEVLSELGQLQAQVQRRYAGYLANPAAERPKTQTMSDNTPQVLYKITCRLSVDQVAIILKAADETRLLAARSFSLVLRSIIPFLSTERMKDFSWKSARSSTMKMEQRDRDIALAALEQLIKKIRDY